MKQRKRYKCPLCSNQENLSSRHHIHHYWAFHRGRKKTIHTNQQKTAPTPPRGLNKQDWVSARMPAVAQAPPSHLQISQHSEHHAKQASAVDRGLHHSLSTQGLAPRHKAGGLKPEPGCTRPFGLWQCPPSQPRGFPVNMPTHRQRRNVRLQEVPSMHQHRALKGSWPCRTGVSYIAMLVETPQFTSAEQTFQRPYLHSLQHSTSSVRRI